MLVAVVPTIAIVVLSAREQRRLLVARASGDVTGVAQLVAERHQRSVDAARGLLLGMSRMRSIAELDGDACSRSLAPLLAREPIFVNIAAARPDGHLFCSAAPARFPVDVSDRAFYVEALRTSSLGVGDFVVSRVRGAGALGFGFPVRNAAGSVVAVAIVSLAVSELQRELDDLPLPAGAQVAVLDRRGVTISARPGGALWAGRPFDQRLVDALRRARGPVVLAGSDGVERLYDLRGVTAPDGTVAMHVLAGIPTAVVLEPVNRVSARALLASLLASGLALAAAVLMAEFTLVRRLRRLATASQRIAAGDWSARTGLQPHRGEVGELVRSFDEMARSLEDLDRQKRQQDDRLRHAQKMEAVGQLAGGVAHDFNNLLTVILSAASALRDRLPREDPGREDACEIIEAGERAAALTRQLLVFSRRQHLAPRVLDVGEAALGMERMLRRLLGETIRFAVDVRASARVHADPAQIELALLNLAVNARDAMPSGGRLDVEVDSLAEDDPRRPTGEDAPAGPLALLCVRDTGKGMDAQTQARMFEPFFTTKSAGHGTGLGLSIVLDVVRQAGGAIRVESAPGRGAEFRLFLPIHAGEGGAAIERVNAVPPRGTETVLVVEDDPRLRAILLRTLSHHGYAVIEAAGAGEALALARAGTLTPDLIVTDVILPDGDGLELAPELATRWPSARVLFISGYTGEHLSEVDALPPDAGLLPKPFTSEMLLVRVREALDASSPPARLQRHG